jgi:hypothetical protein
MGMEVVASTLSTVVVTRSPLKLDLVDSAAAPHRSAVVLLTEVCLITFLDSNEMEHLLLRQTHTRTADASVCCGADPPKLAHLGFALLLCFVS